MSSRFVRLLMLLLLVALVSILFILNPQQTAVNYGPGKVWTAPLALILIVVFCLGVLGSAVASLLVGLQLRYQLRRERKRRQMEKEHFEKLVTVQEYLAVRDLDTARAALERIVEQDQTNVHARLLLADTLQRQGDTDAALRILDEARARNGSNLAVLVKCAELNEASGNLTAAYDNWSLVYSVKPNSRPALTKLVELADALGHDERAIEFQQQLVKSASSGDYEEAQEKLASLRLKSALRHADTSARKPAIDEILKKHRDFGPATAELARLEKEARNPEAASKLWTKAYRATRRIEYLEALAQLWLEAEDPSRAVAAVRAALTSAEDDIEGRFFLVHLFNDLQMREDAARELETLAGKRSAFSKELDVEYDLWRAYLLERGGNHEESARSLARLLEKKSFMNAGNFVQGVRADVRGGSAEQPSPQLSTP